MSFVARVIRPALILFAATTVLAVSLGAIAPPAASGRTRGTTLATGTLTLQGTTPRSCPSGFSCQAFTVACPLLEQLATGTLAIAPATGPVRGLVVFMSGAEGEGFWSTEGTGALSWLNGLRSDGYETVQVAWSTPWLASAPGEFTGPAHLACRPATVIRWIHDNTFASLRLAAPRTGSCGFCATGNSGGASQVSYAIAFYGLGAILNAVIPTSGPPHAAMATGCLGSPGFTYSPGAAVIIDQSYGFTGSGTTGPCQKRDQTQMARWTADSVETGGSAYSYPGTRVQFIVGGQDTGVSPAHASAFRDALVGAGSPMLSYQVVPSMPHSIAASPDGLAALRAAIESTS